jgi:PIN domain nuclease of toxin-antitoxin system
VNFLLDTHALLWWLSDDPALKAEARQSISQASNTIYVSAASAWEISIKKALGKLDAPNDLHAALLANRFEPLPITIDHATSAGQLPRHHDDPFDRMLIAQAQAEQLTLVTHDTIFRSYGIPIIST